MKIEQKSVKLNMDYKQRKINETNSWMLGNINKIGKPLVRLIDLVSLPYSDMPDASQIPSRYSESFITKLFSYKIFYRLHCCQFKICQKHSHLAKITQAVIYVILPFASYGPKPSFSKSSLGATSSLNFFGSLLRQFSFVLLELTLWHLSLSLDCVSSQRQESCLIYLEIASGLPLWTFCRQLSN